MNYLFITGFMSAEVIRAVCWTLLHSLWQGLIAAAIAGIIILSTRHSKAALRYNLLSMVFVGFMVMALLTFLYQPGIVYQSFQPTLSPATSTAGLLPVPQTGNHWAIPVLHKNAFFQPIIYYGNKYSGLIAGIWAVFFFAKFLKMLSGLRYAYRLRYLHTVTPAQEWKERLYTLTSLLGIHTKVLLKESGIVNVPVLVGFLKPVILVPLGMFAHLSVEQVETIFVHELAHVRRKDFAVNLLQRLAESVFFFNPFIVWLSSLIREEREACCDDIVLEYTTDKKSYLEALVSFRETEPPVYSYAMTLGTRYSLLDRVKRILTNENKKLNVMEKITLILVVVGATAFGFIPGKEDKRTRLTDSHALLSQEKPLKKILPDYSARLTFYARATDTLPSRSITFNNITFFNNDNGDDKISEVKATGSDGKKYNYKKLNGEITELSIDDKPVPKEKYQSYEFVVERIEEAWQRNVDRSLRGQKDNLDLLQRKMDLMREQQFWNQQGFDNVTHGPDLLPEDKLILLKNQQNDRQNKALDIQKKNELLFEKKLMLQKEMQADNSLDLLKEQQLDIQKKNQLLLDNRLEANNSLDLLKEQQMDILKNNQLLVEKKRMLQNEWEAENKMERLKGFQPGYTNDDITSIVDDLAEAGIIADKKQISFSLDHNNFIVNGKKQPADLHDKFKAKYIKGKKDHYIYRTDGHSTHTDIVQD